MAEWPQQLRYHMYSIFHVFNYEATQFDLLILSVPLSLKEICASQSSFFINFKFIAIETSANESRFTSREKDLAILGG